MQSGHETLRNLISSDADLSPGNQVWICNRQQVRPSRHAGEWLCLTTTLGQDNDTRAILCRAFDAGGVQRRKDNIPLLDEP